MLLSATQPLRYILKLYHTHSRQGTTLMQNRIKYRKSS